MQWNAHARRGRCSWAVPIFLAAASLAFPLAVVAQGQDRALVLTDTSYVDFGDPGDAFDLMRSGERTFALWLRYTQPQYHAKILNKRGSQGIVGYSVFVHQYSGSLGVWVYGGTPVIASDFAVIGTAGLHPIGDGAWHHVAIIQRDTMLQGYVDGELDFELNISSAPVLRTPKPLRLGWHVDDAVHFVGEMDELSIWDRALTTREIRALMYDSPTAGDVNLAGYWPMNETSGDVVLDHSGHGRHGRAIAANHGPATRPLAPPFRDTITFYALVVLLGALALYGLMRLYARGVHRQKRLLERQVVERTTELGAANRETAEALAIVEAQASRLTELDVAKNRFFTNISHEFRTPLSLIIGPLSDIRGGRLGPLSPALSGQVDGALRNARLLLRLTTQLLDLARLTVGALRLTVYRLDLSALLEGLALAFAPAAERRGITLTTELPAPLWVYGDPQRLETVFSNLLSNACKFTRPGGSVGVVASANVDGTVTVRVTDTGAGVATPDLERIFERFYQGDAGRREGQGSGIGLALTRELIELHGGTIGAASVEGAGTTFTVSLRAGRTHFESGPHVAELHDDTPLFAATPSTAEQTSEPAFEQASTASGDEADRPLVLVVDDNAEIRAYVRSHLAELYRVEEAANGVLALARARACVPDLIVSDVVMPELDGVELLRAVRADPDLAFLPVILLTARAELEDRLEGLAGGADDYLTKPFEPAELRARVANLIALRQRLRERMRTADAAGLPVSADARQPATDGTLEARLRAAIEAHLGDDSFGIDALAAAVFMERTGLYRHTVEEMHTTPSEFLRTVRLARAAELLMDRSNTVSEVAYAIGYRSVSAFSLRFRERYGCSPASYASR